MVYFPIDDVFRVTLVMMVLMEKWAHRDSTEKLENQAVKEIEVWKTNLTENANENYLQQNCETSVVGKEFRSFTLTFV